DLLETRRARECGCAKIDRRRPPPFQPGDVLLALLRRKIRKEHNRVVGAGFDDLSDGPDAGLWVSARGPKVGATDPRQEHPIHAEDHTRVFGFAQGSLCSRPSAWTLPEGRRGWLHPGTKPASASEGHGWRSAS